MTRLHCPDFFSSSASRISLRDSSLDAPRKPQVLMTIASALAASGVMARPSSASRPSMRSESTRFFGQPRLTKATDRIVFLLLAIEKGAPRGKGGYVTEFTG